MNPSIKDLTLVTPLDLEGRFLVITDNKVDFYQGI